MTSEGYLSKLGAGITIRVIDALGAFRILKLCRYFEGSMILALAVGKSLKQLLVPLFMLLLMVFCFAAVVFEIEFDGTINDCVGKWVETTKGNVSTGFIKANRDGVTWDCSVCGMDAECQPGDSGCVSDYEMKCLTCNGYPAGHPECAGVVWGQTFEDIPRSMWFMFVTVSTVGYGDVSPGTWQGQIFVCMVIICGLIFLAMPLAIVGSTFGQVWDERQLIKLQMHLRQLLAENGINPDEAVVAFKKIDSSGDGTVAFEEFKAFTTEFNFELADEEIKEVWKSLDADGSGSMTLEEFITKAYPGIDLATVEGLFPMSEDPLEKLKQQRAQDEKAQIKQRHNEIISAIAEQKQAQVIRHRASSICRPLTTHPTHHYHPTPSLALSLSRSQQAMDQRLLQMEQMLSELVAGGAPTRSNSGDWRERPPPGSATTPGNGGSNGQSNERKKALLEQRRQSYKGRALSRKDSFASDARTDNSPGSKGKPSDISCGDVPQRRASVKDVLQKTASRRNSKEGMLIA